MALPKHKISKSKGRMRRSHNAAKPKQLTRCVQCGTALPTHVVCPNCGFYQGRTVVETDE
jgi:large subunit ribosomal protein L32